MYKPLCKSSLFRMNTLITVAFFDVKCFSYPFCDCKKSALYNIFETFEAQVEIKTTYV